MAKPKPRAKKTRTTKSSKKPSAKRTTAAKRPARRPPAKRKTARKNKRTTISKPWIVKLWEAFNYEGNEIKVANSTPDFRSITDNQGHVGVMWKALSSFQVADGYTAYFYRNPQYIDQIFSGGSGTSTKWLPPDQNDATASMKIVDNATGKMVPEAGDD
ncbi:MAG TPA: hypothetical protein VGH28_02275 [Polyangiaceae bacterium]|jgi:hypothetical protein